MAQFEFLGKVAHTQVSTIFKARDVLLDRLVALKQLAPDMDVAFLHREAQVLALLDHPNIVRVFDVVTLDEGTFLVEDWVEGCGLGAVRDHSGQLTPQQAVGVVRGALTGLAYAHERGVVHGDISPGNILIDLAGVSQLIDFGAAGGSAVSTTGEPLTGSTSRGTPGYRSPEVAEGVAATTRSDVYSVAAVLSDLLSGKRSDGPGLLSGGSAVGDVLRRAMSTDPADRQADAGVLLAELEEAAERALGRGWMALAGMSGLVSATLGGAGVALIGGGTTVGTAVAAESASVASATPFVVGARRAAGSSAKRWWAVGAGAVGTAAVIVVAMLIADRSGQQTAAPTAAAPAAAPVSSVPAVAAVPTASTTSASAQLPTSVAAVSLPRSTTGQQTLPTLARTLTSPKQLTPSKSTPPKPPAKGFNGTYKVIQRTTKSVNFPANPVGFTKTITWHVTSACSDGRCPARVQSSSGSTYTLTPSGSVFTRALNESFRCIVHNTGAEYGDLVGYKGSYKYKPVVKDGTVATMTGTGRYEQVDACALGTFDGQVIDHVDEKQSFEFTVTITRTGD